MASYKVGDRVRRTVALACSDIREGDTGSIVRSNYGEWIVLDDRDHVERSWSPDNFELLPAAPAEPTGSLGEFGSAKQAAPQAPHQGMTDSYLAQQNAAASANMQMAQQQGQMLGYGAWEPADVTKLKAEHANSIQVLNTDIAALRAELKAVRGQLAAAIQSKTVHSDVCGERDRLRDANAFLADDVRYYEREVTRLGGKVRPARKGAK